MAVWRPQVTPGTEAALNALGPYDVPHAGLLIWRTARGFAWSWGGSADLCFIAHPRSPDADYQGLLEAWRRVCGRREAVLAAIRDAVRESWAKMAGSANAGTSDDPILRDVRGCTFVLRTGPAGQIAAEAEVGVGWDDEEVIRVDLVADDRLSESLE